MSKAAGGTGIVRQTLEFIMITSETLKKSSTEKNKRQSTAKRRSTKKQIDETKQKEEQRRKNPIAYLYVHMEKLINAPQSKNKVEIQLDHVKGTITKLDTAEHRSTTIDLSDFDRVQPTFSIAIEQDSVEELNEYSNNPLLVTMYEHIKVMKPIEKTDSEAGDGEATEEEEVEILEPIAQGLIDLLQFFCKHRSMATLMTFLYPLPNANTERSWGTCKTIWNIYTLMPLLKEITFCNMAFITLESIYNTQYELLQDGIDDLTLTLSFISTLPNEMGEYDTIKICQFGMFSLDVISEQNTNQKWENMKSLLTNNIDALSIQSGCKMSTHLLFKSLLRSEKLEFDFNEINIDEEHALVCNSVQRFVLTEELSKALIEVVGFNKQHVLVQLHRRNASEGAILLQGTFDLSVFLYPKVNACRFAVELSPPDAKTKQSPPPRKSSRKRSIPTSNRSRSEDKDRPTFAIISICLLTPITDSMEALSAYNETQMKREKLKRCITVLSEVKLMSSSQVYEENYTNFDTLVGSIIDHIVKNEIKRIDDAKDYFCCQLGNIINNILKLISCDFNVRFPTKNTTEFANLMTIVYKELTQRCYTILQNCDNETNSLEKCCITNFDTQNKIINIVNTIKYMHETGNEDMADFLYKKLRRLYPNNATLNFYIYLYDVERQNFASAKEYNRLPLTKRELHGEYFTELVTIYIKYVETLPVERSYNEAIENLLCDLRTFAETYPHQIHAWILLHCIYKRFSYLPGMTFTRWKYENLYNSSRKHLPIIPKSRWEIYNNWYMNFVSKASRQFYYVLLLFLHLGVYQFAEFVYSELAAECSPAENHFMTTTFKLILNKLDEQHSQKTFANEKSLYASQLEAYQAQINGNIAYYRGDMELAMYHYEHILDINDLVDYVGYQLALFRYAYTKSRQEEYLDAVKAFEKCCILGDKCLLANLGMGKAMYKLGRLKEAEEHFAISTNNEMHVPDVWAYLALINLKLGNNFKALEFWKYAKINPSNIISEEILQELEMINPNDISLYVDVPK